MKFKLLILFLLPIAVFAQSNKIEYRQLKNLPLSTDTASVSATEIATPLFVKELLKGVYNSIESVNDSTFTLNKIGGGKDTIQIIVAGGSSSGSSSTSALRTAKTASDYTNSSNSTWVDVTALSFSVEANKAYAFEFYVIFQSASTTTGINFTFTTPSGATVTALSSVPVSTSSGNFLTVNTAGASSSASTGVAATGSNALAKVSGIITNGSTAGTLQLQVRSEVNSSQVTVKSGSVATITQID